VVFSSIDHTGRYAFGEQPRIALWNLTRFAETLLGLGVDVESMKGVLGGFSGVFEGYWTAMMQAKLGLGSDEMVAEILNWLEESGADHTNFFRGLADALERGVAVEAPWGERWRGAVRGDAVSTIRAAAPAVVPRNHLVDAALKAGVAGDLGPLRALVAALAAPYEETQANAAFRVPAGPGEAITQTFCGT
jgi:uncharacterized protein YdiU (UPF0061 family)